MKSRRTIRQSRCRLKLFRLHKIEIKIKETRLINLEICLRCNISFKESAAQTIETQINKINKAKQAIIHNK